MANWPDPSPSAFGNATLDDVEIGDSCTLACGCRIQRISAFKILFHHIDARYARCVVVNACRQSLTLCVLNHSGPMTNGRFVCLHHAANVLYDKFHILLAEAFDEPLPPRVRPANFGRQRKHPWP